MNLEIKKAERTQGGAEKVPDLTLLFTTHSRWSTAHAWWPLLSKLVSTLIMLVVFKYSIILHLLIDSSNFVNPVYLLVHFVTHSSLSTSGDFREKGEYCTGSFPSRCQEFCYLFRVSTSLGSV